MASSIRRAFVAALLASLFTNCYQQYYPTASSRLVDIPTPPLPKDQPVELYFTGEQPSDPNYLKIKLLEVGGFQDYTSLANRLKAVAREEGLDAVIAVVQQQNAANANVLTGVGIKYRKNIDYLNNFPKTQQVFRCLNGDTAARQLVTTVELNFYGVPKQVMAASPEEEEYYQSFVKPYSFPFFYTDRDPHWHFLTNQSHQVIRRQWVLNSVPRLDYGFTYDAKKRPSVVTFKDSRPKTIGLRKATFYLTYDGADRLVEKVIQEKGQLRYRERIFYSPSGRLLETLLYEVRDNREVPFLKSTFSHYTLADI